MKKLYLICLVVLLAGCQKADETQRENITGNLYRIWTTYYEKMNGKWELVPVYSSLPWDAQVYWLIEEIGVRKYTYFPLYASGKGDIALYDTDPGSYYFKPDYGKGIVKTNIFGEERTDFILQASDAMGFVLRYYPEEDRMNEINMRVTEFSEAFEEALPDTPENRELVNKMITEAMSE